MVWIKQERYTEFNEVMWWLGEKPETFSKMKSGMCNEQICTFDRQSDWPICVVLKKKKNDAV